MIFFDLKQEGSDEKKVVSVLILQIILPYTVLFVYSRKWKKTVGNLFETYVVTFAI